MAIIICGHNDYHYDTIRLQIVENNDYHYDTIRLYLPLELDELHKKTLHNIPLGLIGKGVLINQHLFQSINGSVACEVPHSKLEIQRNIGRETNLTHELNFVLTPSLKTKTMLIPTL